MAFHRIADADSADQQRGQADDGEELGEALDVAFQPRRRIGAGADVPAGLRQLRARLVGDRLQGGVIVVARWQLQPVMPAHQAARLNEAGGAQAGGAHHQARAEADAAGKLIRLTGERRANGEAGTADAHARARLDIEPCQQRRIGHRAIDAVALGERRGKWARRIERDRAEQRVSGIDGLQFDQCRLAARRARHGAQRGGGRERAVALQEGALVRFGLALDQVEVEIAAEDDLALAREAVGEARRQRADAGDRHHAERDAGDEDIEAAQAPAHLAQREAQGEPTALAQSRC